MKDVLVVTRKLGVTRKSDQRDRRPTLDERDKIMEHSRALVRDMKHPGEKIGNDTRLNMSCTKCGAANGQPDPRATRDWDDRRCSPFASAFISADTVQASTDHPMKLLVQLRSRSE